jgi:hypothetical protein
MFVCQSNVPIEQFRGVQRGRACHRLGSSYTRGLALCHGAPRQEVNKGLCPHPLVVYLGREGEQGAPYSSPTIHIVLPLACMGLGSVKCKHRLICLEEFEQPQIMQLFFWDPIPTHEMGTDIGCVTQFP